MKLCITCVSLERHNGQLKLRKKICVRLYVGELSPHMVEDSFIGTVFIVGT